MKLLLTGGTGFFGKAILGHLLRLSTQGVEPPDLTIISRSPASFIKDNPRFAGLQWLKFHECNILDAKSLPSDKSFTHILHAATESTNGLKLPPLARYQQIIEGANNILSFAKQCPIEKIMLTSSGAVYGTSLGDSFSEDSCTIPNPLDPEMSYGMGKRAAEHLCSLYKDAYGIQFVVARCFAFIGEDLPTNAHFAIGNFIEDALSGRDIVIKGTGMQKRTYMYQDDLAAWLLAILDKGQSGEAYNVGSDRPVTIKDLAYLVRDIVNPNVEVKILGGIGSGGRDSYIPNIDKSILGLDLSIKVELDSAIRLTVNALRSTRLSNV
jgi:UDP-glucuronate decarboxylase